MKEFYTKLTYERKTPDDVFPDEFSITENTWDMGLDRLLDIFKSLTTLASWSENQFDNALVEYLESKGYSVEQND